MELENIKNNKELSRKLASIYKSLNAVIDDDSDLKKFSYTEREVDLGNDYKAINERSAFNRLKKIKSLKDLFENWDAFNTLYKDDKIINKIGAEFIENKFEFNQNIIQTIKNYPTQKEPLYYFKKNEVLDTDNINTQEYEVIKQKILPAIEKDAKEFLEQKQALIKIIDTLMARKSHEIVHPIHSVNLGPHSLINSEPGKELFDIKKQIQKGNFVAKKTDNILIVELPITGNIMFNNQKSNSPTILFKVDIDKPHDYLIEVDSLQQLNEKVKNNIMSMREKSLNLRSKNSNTI